MTGAAAPVPAPATCAGEHCITCADEGIVMTVVRSDGSLSLCRDASGDSHEVALDLVAPLEAGERVLVHAGVAIGRPA